MGKIIMNQSIWTEQEQGLPADWFKRPDDQYKCYIFPASEASFFIFLYSNLYSAWPSYVRKYKGGIKRNGLRKGSTLFREVPVTQHKTDWQRVVWCWNTVTAVCIWCGNAEQGAKQSTVLGENLPFQKNKYINSII